MASPSPRFLKRKQHGFELLNRQQYGDAAALFAELCAKQPRDADLYGALGYALLHLGRLPEAIASYQRVVERIPNHWKGHADLANALRFAGRLGQAAEHNRAALRLHPPDPTVLWDNLGICLCGQGKFDEAATAHRKALGLNPSNSRAHSNLLLTLHYLPDGRQETLLEEHRAWGKRYGPAAAAPRHTNTRAPERRLRVGYLSADLRTHSVSYFLEPLLAHHNRDQVEVVGYAHLSGGDATTQRLLELCDGWRWVGGHSPAAIARQIYSDRIDLLVELGGHTSSELLAVCCLRPAPVQVTYLGYPNTTGVPQIDYRLVDETTDPPGAERWCSEALVRVPGCFLCYRPSPDAPPVAGLPAAANGHITFGSFNNLAKVNEAVVAVWAEILRRCSTARLLVKNPSLDDPPTRDRYRALFQARGVGSERIDLRGRTVSVSDHLALYGKVDIALDTFPYNGTTTTCEALWQGVPVVTVAGNTHAARVGASLLKAAGLDGLIAQDRDAYKEIATRLANDPDELVRLRASLREQLRTSTLCDGAAFASKVEAAYRTLWHRWCATNPA